jgi:hypothetical protein
LLLELTGLPVVDSAAKKNADRKGQHSGVAYTDRSFFRQGDRFWVSEKSSNKINVLYMWYYYTALVFGGIE